MAQITFTIDDSYVDRIATAYGWTTGSKGTYVKNVIIKKVKDDVKGYEIRVAQNSAIINVTDIDIT